MLYFRIQKRRFSSNVIEASKDKEKWFVYLIPAIKKAEGDILCNLMLQLSDPSTLSEAIEEKLFGKVKTHQDWANRFNIRGDIKEVLLNK